MYDDVMWNLSLNDHFLWLSFRSHLQTVPESVTLSKILRTYTHTHTHTHKLKKPKTFSVGFTHLLSLLTVTCLTAELHLL